MVYMYTGTHGTALLHDSVQVSIPDPGSVFFLHSLLPVPGCTPV